MLIAILIAAAPWVAMSGGPVFIRGGNGPMVRLELGYPLGDRAAAELWLSGAIASTPTATPGDSALASLGAGGRLLIARLDSEGRFALWAHGGGGWGVPAAGGGSAGPTGFGGGLLSFQPLLHRFSLGLEADALAYRKSWGAAVMPSLRCSF